MAKLICFHGTSKENAQAILAQNHFNHGMGKNLRLGEGAYFFNQMGSSPEYTIMCAKEMRKYKWKHDRATPEYSILRCVIECDDSYFFDLYEPDVMETFHKMRYLLHEKTLKENPSFQYENASQADAQVICEIKKLRKIAIIRSPQFFGLFEKEQRMEFSNKRISQNPRTFAPNVINVCVDTNIAQINKIEIVEEGIFDDGYASIIG